jgi:shikimate kinase
MAKTEKNQKNQKVEKFGDYTPKVARATLVFLSGFMGCGKTTAGKAAAEKAGVQFVDLDAEVEKTAGISVAEIFEQNGEDAFRRLESANLALVIAAASMVQTKAIVCALGGGALASKQNAELVTQHGVSIFIDSDFESCCDRIKDDKERPLATSREELEELFRERQQIYIANSHHVVDGNCDVDTLAERIKEIINAVI